MTNFSDIHLLRQCCGDILIINVTVAYGPTYQLSKSAAQGMPKHQTTSQLYFPCSEPPTTNGRKHTYE